jgi:hypothetical protein
MEESMVSLTLRPLYPSERAPGTHWIGGWVGPIDGLDAVAKWKGPWPYWEQNPGRPARSLVTILTELCNNNNNKTDPTERRDAVLNLSASCSSDPPFETRPGHGILRLKISKQPNTRRTKN